MSHTRALLCVISGAALWGILGLFVQYLYQLGFSPWEAVAIRVLFSALLLTSFLLIMRPSYLRINLTDLPFFIGTGVLSIVFFNWCYFSVMEESSLSLAVTLLYTGPLFVTIISRFLFKESLTNRKILSVLFTIAGCAFAVGLLPSLQAYVSFPVIALGIGSGLFYAMYSIFGKYVSKRYSSLTITVYSFLCASVFMLPAGGLIGKIDVLLQGEALLAAFGLALIPTVLAYYLYTNGLRYMESSRASILTTIEPIVGILTGVIIFGEHLSNWQLFGMLLVLSSVFLVTERKRSVSVASS